uniref:Uncharacterized protein n=1 Tax=Kalanchoe fedtschenkoi TaxID=63787 RepID=A0A7N0RDG8_KALFE
MGAVGVWDCGSSLYDAFELVSFSHLLERRMMLLPHDHARRGGSSDAVDSEKPVGKQLPDSRFSRRKVGAGLMMGFVKSLGGLVERLRKRRVFSRGKIGPQDF